jgi:hypothetical protein
LQAFRPGQVDLPAGAREGAGSINIAGFGEFDMDEGIAELEYVEKSILYLVYCLDLHAMPSNRVMPQVDQWMAAATQTVARKQDITLDESDTVSTSQTGRHIFPACDFRVICCEFSEHE